MSLIIVPNPSTSQVESSYSQPDHVSLCVTDDGGGGNLLLNGQGVTSGLLATAADIPTYFGATLFKSIPLMRAFRKTTSIQAANDQFFKNLNIAIYGLTGTPPASNPSVTVTFETGGFTGVPFLVLVGPGISAFWRVEIGLRHSLPG